MRVRVVAGLLSLLVSMPAMANPSLRPVTVDELMKLRTVNNVRISPDGSQVLYVVAEADFDRDEYVPVLWRVAANGGTPTRLTWTTRLFNRPRPDPRVAWSPDGRWISFLAYAEGRPQVFVMPAAGGEPRQATIAPTGVGVYSWSPDSMRFAYLAPDPPSEQERQAQAGRTFVIEVHRDPAGARVWVQALEGGEAMALTPPSHYAYSFSWSPDGGTIAYAASTLAGFMGPYHSGLFTVPASGGEPHVLLQRPGMNNQPLYSPDGRWIAFLTTEGVETLLANLDLAVMPASGGEPINLSAPADEWVQEFVWDADSDGLYYYDAYPPPGSGARMFEQQIRRAGISDRSLRIVTEGRRQCFDLSLSADGTRLAFKSSDATSMGDIVVASTDEWSEQRITDLHPDMRQLDWGALEPMSWRSFDGMEIWGLLLTPPGYARDRPIPLVVYAHGGPIGGFGYGVFPQFPHTVGQVTPYPVQAMAAEGMAVLMPMPRGGAGYGEEGFRAIVGTWGDGDYKDIMAGVDALVAGGVADPARLGIMGASYGGFMTSWVVTQTDRFAAASTGASVTDLYGMYTLSDAGDVTTAYFGEPWSNLESYLQHSPLTHAAHVTTPLLIQHGENDLRVPLSQAREFYKVLKAMGKTVEFEIYPRGGHVVYEPDLQRQQKLRNLAWFKRWLLR